MGQTDWDDVSKKWDACIVKTGGKTLVRGLGGAEGWRLAEGRALLASPYLQYDAIDLQALLPLLGIFERLCSYETVT